MTTTSHRGRCPCGAVEIEATGEPAVMGFCHCDSCRTWLAAPVHGFMLWPQANVKVVKGADQLGLYKKTENSHRQFCRQISDDHAAVGQDVDFGFGGQRRPVK